MRLSAFHLVASCNSMANGEVGADRSEVILIGIARHMPIRVQLLLNVKGLLPNGERLERVFNFLRMHLCAD